MSGSVESEGGHLNYYKAHGISPVRYAMADLSQHLQIRDSLYRSIGLPSVAFRGVDVLEIAPGSGQNSLYLALAQPRSLTLVEPNPAGLNDLKALYGSLSVPHTEPDLHPVRLQEFCPGKSFDIVLCENWLGALPEEVDLLKKLAGFVSPGGALVVTVVPLAGFFPNVMRKLLALRIAPPSLDFEAKTNFLVEAFGTHLSTLASMTRSHRDWVHDCMMNPHYLNVGLPFETVIAALGQGMDMLGTYPKITTDWRWFKGLKGDQRRFNEQLLESVAANIPSLLDYRKTFLPGAAGEYAVLNELFAAIHRRALVWQQAFEAANAPELERATLEITDDLGQVAAMLQKIDRDLADAVEELRRVWLRPAVSAADVREMSLFNGVFGRETFYIALTKKHPIVEGTH